MGRIQRCILLQAERSAAEIRPVRTPAIWRLERLLLYSGSRLQMFRDAFFAEADQSLIEAKPGDSGLVALFKFKVGGPAKIVWSRAAGPHPWISRDM